MRDSTSVQDAEKLLEIVPKCIHYIGVARIQGFATHAVLSRNARDAGAFQRFSSFLRLGDVPSVSVHGAVIRRRQEFFAIRLRPLQCCNPPWQALQKASPKMYG